MYPTGTLHHRIVGVGAILTLALASSIVFTSMTAASPFTEPIRLTDNNVTDATTSGSLMESCGIYTAVWRRDVGASQIMWAESDWSGVWTEPQPIEPGTHMEYGVRLAVSDISSSARHIIWRRHISPTGEIMHAWKHSTGDWIIEQVTSTPNASEARPDIADMLAGDGRLHATWVTGYPSDDGYIYYAVKDNGVWQIESLGLDLGTYWGGAEPHIDVGQDGIVHIVHLDCQPFDDSVHYARLEDGVWTSQILDFEPITSLKIDVTARDPSRVLVAMSGQVGHGDPLRVYVRESLDGGLSFGPPVLVSGEYEAMLGNVVDGPYGGQVVATTYPEHGGAWGNIIISTENSGWVPEELPPGSETCRWPSTSQAICVSASPGVPGGMSVLFTDDEGLGYGHEEVYFLGTPIPGSVTDHQGSPAARLRIAAMPNPFAVATWITVDGSSENLAGAGVVGLYDPSGRLVRRLVMPGTLDQHGSAVVRWDGKRADGRQAASGAYFVRYEGQTVSDGYRVVLVR